MLKAIWRDVASRPLWELCEGAFLGLAFVGTLAFLLIASGAFRPLLG